ncbi:MAG: hypothetical protein E7602_00915 [Ruminococcaceae bacterium]|nr:hypothetical protein [Oscillospiraceae bacterium]
MKKSLKLSLILVSILLLCVFVISCSETNTDTDGVENDFNVSTEFSYADGTYSVTVNSSISSYDFRKIIELIGDAQMELSKTETFDELLDISNVALDYGENVFYVRISNVEDAKSVLVFNITRKELYTVEFNTDGGSSVESIQVEAGTVLEAPQSIKTGYTLSWDYDFNTPINSDITINAVWTPKDYKIAIYDTDVEIEISYNEEYDLTSSIVEKNGYRFDGFYYVENDHEFPFLTEGIYNKTQDVTIYPKYDTIKYSITYVVEKGGAHSNETNEFTINDVVNLAPAEWTINDEKIFAGWYTSESFEDGTKVTSIKDCYENITLWAKFDDLEFRTLVDFVVGDTKTQKEFIYKSPYTLISQEAPFGYNFVGWCYNDELVDFQGVWSYKDKTLEFVAKFAPITYNVIYDLPSGAQNNNENPLQYNADMNSVELNNPTFNNHEFQGWYLDADFNNPVTELTLSLFENEVILYSKWLYVSNVTLDAGEGNCDTENLVLNYGGEYSLPNVTRVGYVFLGWYYRDDDVEFKGVWPYKDSEITLVAKYEIRNNKIEYRLPDGASNNINNPKEFNIETGDFELLAPMFGSNIFLGWYLEPSFDTEVKILTAENTIDDITLYSKWQYVTSVTFDANGGSCQTTEATFKHGEKHTLPTVTKTGYTFIGWYYGETKIDSNDTWNYKISEITLVAKFLAIEYNIIYNLPEGAINDSYNVNVYTADKGSIELKAPIYGIHQFQGWYLDTEFNTEIKSISISNVYNGITLYPKWQYVSDVKFDTDGANDNYNSLQFLFGEVVTLPTPIKSGCLFGGWYCGDNKVTNGVWNYKENVTLVAHWVPTTIAINYVLNDGVQNPQNPSTFDVYTGIIVLKAPTKLYYTFEGWYTDPDFKTRVEQIDTSVVREITLYAKWRGIIANLDFGDDTGYLPNEEIMLHYNSSYSLPVPERIGYTFDGWYYNGNKIENTGIWLGTENNVSIVAKWSKEEYKISYDLNGVTNADVYVGTVENEDGTITKIPAEFVNTYYVTSDEFTLPRLYRDGYIFLGWESSNGDRKQVVTIRNGSTGDRAYKAKWVVNTNEDGFVFELEGDHMVCVGFAKDPTSAKKLNMPSDYSGIPVTAIAKNAFTEFGIKFGNSAYKNKDYYFTFTIPMSITLIQTDAFDKCNGICVQLRDNNGKTLDFQSESVLREWEKNVSYSSGKVNKQVRDCIWGFRPAIGWTRFSAVTIPPDYEASFK